MSLIAEYDKKVSDGDLIHDPAQDAILHELDRVRTALLTPEKKRGWFRKTVEPIPGLYIWGGVGRGKSMLMDMFAESLSTSVRRVHFHAFMQDVHAGMAKARANGVSDAIIPVAESMSADIRCLAFDEMQITDITDAMIVGRLFEQLFQRDITIVATSNRHPDDLYKDGLNRTLFLPFIDLLKSKMVLHEVQSPTDYRQNRLKGRGMYFTPLDQTSAMAMDALWNDLTGQKGSPLRLQVKGRIVELPAFHNGVGRASFYQLCGTALGAADYLAIAENVKVLLLDNVPILSQDNNNEAKRFVTLIDALYEARVKLAISAAAMPEALYPKGAGSFEFERTASRLQEMQAADWGQSD